MTEVVATSEDGKLRAVVTLDTDAERPDYDGGPWIFRVDWTSWGKPDMDVLSEASGYGTLPSPEDGLSSALERWGSDWDRVERYLRIFHDVVVFERLDRRTGGCLLAVATRELVEAWGCTVEQAVSEGFPSSWCAWEGGDAWGIAVERLRTWESEGETEERWEDVDACYGFYGRAYAETEALSMLHAVKSEKVAP
jgi:hypothetical protein